MSKVDYTDLIINRESTEVSGQKTEMTRKLKSTCFRRDFEGETYSLHPEPVT